ncbi:MAG: LuxR C-terminal-related transcriptional regulator [Pseudoruegeria sp.]
MLVVPLSNDCMRQAAQIAELFEKPTGDASSIFLAADPLALIDVIGSKDFFNDLSDTLANTYGFECFHIFLYQIDAQPVSLANRPALCNYQRGLNNYLKFSYVINPVFRAFQDRAASGVYLISDFVPDDFKRVIDTADIDIFVDESEAIGYRTPGWPKNMAECIVLVQLPNGIALDFSFLVPRGRKKNSVACSAHLERLFPVLERVVRRQFEIDPSCFDYAPQRPSQEDRFQDFGSHVLTNREMQVVQLILVGHTSSSVSLQLGVSVSTVKSHRRNIYVKFGISSQAELFNLFMLHLKND